MINESTMRSFLTLVRVGSFTEAAQQLYLSQQAVSKQVAKLEQDLGCTLIDRRRGKLKLTPEGEIYFKAFTQVEGILTKARREAARVSAGVDNTLSIGQPELLDLHEIHDALMAQFNNENANLKIVYRSDSSLAILELLEQGKVDVAFGFGNELEGRRGLECVPLARLWEVLVVSTRHPKATDEAALRDFREETVFYLGGVEEDAEFGRRMERIGFPTDKLVPTENLLSSVASVEQMQGVAFMLENCRMLKSDTLRTYPSYQNATLMLACRKGEKKQSVRRLMAAAQQISKDIS